MGGVEGLLPAWSLVVAWSGFVTAVRRIGNPSRLRAVVFEARRVPQRVLRCIHRQIHLVVLGGLFDGVEAHCDIFFAGAEEPANADDYGTDLTTWSDKHVHHFADLGVGWIVDVLFVP